MKFPIISLLTLSLSSFNADAQICNCNQEFKDVKDKIEQNYAGFKDKVMLKQQLFIINKHSVHSNN